MSLFVNPLSTSRCAGEILPLPACWVERPVCQVRIVRVYLSTSAYSREFIGNAALLQLQTFSVGRREGSFGHVRLCKLHMLFASLQVISSHAYHGRVSLTQAYAKLSSLAFATAMTFSFPAAPRRSRLLCPRRLDRCSALPPAAGKCCCAVHRDHVCTSTPIHPHARECFVRQALLVTPYQSESAQSPTTAALCIQPQTDVHVHYVKLDRDRSSCITQRVEHMSRLLQSVIQYANECAGIPTPKPRPHTPARPNSAPVKKDSDDDEEGDMSV